MAFLKNKDMRKGQFFLSESHFFVIAKKHLRAREFSQGFEECQTPAFKINQFTWAKFFSGAS